jgi:hypothetical protein
LNDLAFADIQRVAAVQQLDEVISLGKVANIGEDIVARVHYSDVFV